MFPDLNGKKAVVTGGTRGIGRAVSLGLARAGATVVAVYRGGVEAAQSLERELKETGGDHAVVRADVSGARDVAHLVENATAVLGDRIDIVVNNAGAISHLPYQEISFEEWQRVLATNLTSAHLVTQGLLPRLGAGASVINVGSAVAVVGLPLRAHYTASKSGLIGLTRSLSKELGKRGIRVNTVAPGVIETDQASGLTPEARKAYTGRIPLGRLGEPEQVANAVLFLASDASAYITGTTLNVDGGI